MHVCVHVKDWLRCVHACVCVQVKDWLRARDWLDRSKRSTSTTHTPTQQQGELQLQQQGQPCSPTAPITHTPTQQLGEQQESLPCSSKGMTTVSLPLKEAAAKTLATLYGSGSGSGSGSSLVPGLELLPDTLLHGLQKGTMKVRCVQYRLVVLVSGTR